MVRKMHIKMNQIRLLKEKIRKRFEKTAIELIDVGIPNLWTHFKDGTLMVFYKVCGKMGGMKRKGDTWWWNKDVKEATSRKMHTRQCLEIFVRIRTDIKVRVKQRYLFQKHDREDWRHLLGVNIV